MKELLLTEEITINLINNNWITIVSIIVSALAAIIAACVPVFYAKFIDKKRIYIETITKGKPEWLSRLKQNISLFLSTVITEPNCVEKYKKLFALKVLIKADLNILKVEQVDNYNHVREYNNKVRIFLKNDSSVITGISTDYGISLEKVILLELDRLCSTAMNVNPGTNTLEMYSINIEKLIVLTNLFYSMEWAQIKQENKSKKSKELIDNLTAQLNIALDKLDDLVATDEDQ